jgi:hypothetical protein
MLVLGRQYIVVATISVREYPEVDNTLNYSFIAIDGEPPVEESIAPEEEEVAPENETQE